MCSRFTLNVIPDKIKEYFDLTGELDLSPSWNIASTTPINSINADKDVNRHLRLIYWSLIPSWAKDKSIGNRLTNARSETVAEKLSFRAAFKRRRCLIPAIGFYEWKSEDNKKTTMVYQSQVGRVNGVCWDMGYLDP